MNPHSTHPSQDQDGKDPAFTASTAELFKPLPTIEEINTLELADSYSGGPAKAQLNYIIAEFSSIQNG